MRKTEIPQIKIGDFIGRSNFPYEIGEVIGIESGVYVVRVLSKNNKNGSEIIRGITDKHLKKGFFAKMDIQDGEIVD